ncbi:MAG: PLDc N-terminal domain-containing protein [Saprospiraceae bacterium]
MGSSFKDKNQKWAFVCCLFFFPMLGSAIYFIIGNYSKIEKEENQSSEEFV